MIRLVNIAHQGIAACFRSIRTLSMSCTVSILFHLGTRFFLLTLVVHQCWQTRNGQLFS